MPMERVEAELKKASQWSRDNASKRKTPRGIYAFLNRWFNSAVDRPAKAAGWNGKPGRRRGIQVPPADEETQALRDRRAHGQDDRKWGPKPDDVPASEIF